ncbi:hypothetical protein ACSBR2_018613 [Camellia fascicularis]
MQQSCKLLKQGRNGGKHCSGRMMRSKNGFKNYLPSDLAMWLLSEDGRMSFQNPAALDPFRVRSFAKNT